MNLLSVVLLLAVVPASGEAERERVRIVLELAKARHLPDRESPLPDNPEAVLREAERTGRPVLVWVGDCVEEVRAALPECLHCRVNQMHGETTPRVLLRTPTGWYSWDRRRLDADSVPEIRRMIRR